MSAACEALEDRFARIMALSQIHGVLHWDCETIMPSGGAGSRTDQLAVPELLAHEHKTDSLLSDLLDETEVEPPHAPWQAKNLELMRREWRHANAIPADLVEATSRASSTAIVVCMEARPQADFARFLPTFGESIRLTREIAAAPRPKSSVSHSTMRCCCLTKTPSRARRSTISSAACRRSCRVCATVSSPVSRARPHQAFRRAPFPSPGRNDWVSG